MPEFNIIPEQIANISRDSAIEFDNTKGHNVYLGAFHKANVVYTDFLYEFVVKPFAGAEYIWSSGYGGVHMLLAGFTAADGSTASRVGGNTVSETGLTSTSFQSADYLFINHWHHFSIGYDSAFVTVYCHGVPSFQVAKTDGRLALVRGVDATGYIGGSNHSNFNGRWAGITAYENLHPFTADNIHGTVYVPRVHPRSALYLSDTTFASPVLRIDPTAGSLADISKGFEGQPHPGILNEGSDVGVSFLTDSSSDKVAANLPIWVYDPVEQTDSCPLTNPGLPALAKGGDNFCKGDITRFWFDTTNLGTSEAGSLAAQAWLTSTPYGVLAGRAYLSGAYPGAGAPATLTGDSVTQRAEIAVSGFKTNGPWLYINYTDANNYFRIGYYYTPGLHQLTALKCIAGVESAAGSATMSGGSTYAADYTLSLERTAGNHYIGKYGGVTWVDYDDSANPHLTGVKVGFGIENNHFARVDYLYHW